MSATTTNPSDRDSLVDHLTVDHCVSYADSLSRMGALMVHADAHLTGVACRPHDHAVG